jgi:aminomethyltransferase
MVTSGGFSPTLGMPIAMGFVPPGLAAAGTRLEAVVRGRSQPAIVVPLPFVPHRYVRHTRSGDQNAIHHRA